MGDICGHSVCLPKQQLLVLSPCFPGSDWTSACLCEVVNEFLSVLLSHTAFAFPIKQSVS